MMNEIIQINRKYLSMVYSSGVVFAEAFKNIMIATHDHYIRLVGNYKYNVYEDIPYHNKNIAKEHI